MLRRFALLLVPLLSACGAAYVRAQEPDLVRRASFDMGCPEASLHVVELGERVRGVEGCEKKGTYIYDVNAAAWVLNTEQTRGTLGSAPAPMPATPQPYVSPPASR